MIILYFYHVFVSFFNTILEYFIKSCIVNSYISLFYDIENSLHWVLDMTFREDESRVRQRRLADNLGWLRRLALTLLKQHPGKQSIAMKRRLAGCSIGFLMQVLTGKAT